MKKLPIGIQTFSEIITENYCYVDKTPFISKLADSGKNYFLSRPRRFGKSLFLDTLSEAFKGSKELFEGLYIYDRWDWTEKHPVIKISFGSGKFGTAEGFEKKINEVLTFHCKIYELSKNDVETLSDLVISLYEKFNHKVVILIDEYDKPILDNITEPEIARISRTALRDFFGSIKDLDQYLKFVFITGVSKFSKMNLFSGLNNLEDITIRNAYADITGYTQNDLETVFAMHLKNVDMKIVKRWYNGYNYFGEPVYNPFDILLFISASCEFRNYWWETGNPAFLIEKLKEQKFYIPDLDNIEVNEEVLNTFDIEKIDLIALLWQTGYLTFDKKIIDHFTGLLSYCMKIPNLEIQLSLNNLFMKYFTDLDYQLLPIASKIKDAIFSGKAYILEEIIYALFAAIPYNNYANNIIANYEGYYSSVVYTFFATLGVDIIAEDTTNKGRIDLTLKTPDSVFIIEFKVDSNESAIHQIKERGYYEKYQGNYQNIYLIGMRFSSIQKNITDFQWEKLEENH